MAKNGVYCCYRYCSKLFGKMRRETEFRQRYCRNCKKKVQCFRGERKLNFGNEITEILVLPALPEMETNCGNGITENGRKKKKKNCGNKVAEN